MTALQLTREWVLPVLLGLGFGRLAWLVWVDLATIQCRDCHRRRWAWQRCICRGGQGGEF